MYKFKIGKATLCYNFADANKVEIFEKAFQAFAAAQDNKPSDSPASVQIRYICGTVFDLFNTIFGPGTADIVFGDTCDMESCFEAASQLVDARQKADAEIGKRIRNMSAKYAPKQ